MNARISVFKTISSVTLGVLYLVGVAILLLPTHEVAAVSTFIPCNGINCSACDLVKMANVIIVWLIGVLIVLFGVLIAIAGFNLVVSQGTGGLKEAKERFINTIIGLLIILAAWLIVDTIMRGLNVSDRNGPFPWSAVQCQVQVQPWPGDPSTTPGAPPLTGATGSPINPVGGCQGATCVALSDPRYNVPCSNQNSCAVSPDLAARLSAFHALAGIPGARVTEGMPPTREHRSPCHSNGTCVDYSVAGGMSAQHVVTAIQAARESGLRPVYEVQTAAQRDALVAAGAPAGNIQVLGNWITSPHFSIYGQ